VRKSIAKVPSQKVTRRPKCLSSFSCSSDGIVQNCMTLSQSFSHKTVAFYTEQCTSPSLFHNFVLSRGSLNYSLNNYGFIFDTIFFTGRHAHKSLGSEMYLLLKIAELEIQLCAWRQGEPVIHCWLGVGTEPSQQFFSQIHLLRKPTRTDLLLSNRWKTSAQVSTCC